MLIIIILIEIFFIIDTYVKYECLILDQEEDFYNNYNGNNRNSANYNTYQTTSFINPIYQSSTLSRLNDHNQMSV